MKIPALGLVLATVALSGCDSLLGPRTYEDAIVASEKAIRESDMAKAFKLCLRAFDLADKVGNGRKAISALDCAMATSTRLGKPELAFRAYATVLGTYDNDLKTSSSRLRLRNNHAVALYSAGRKDEGLKALDEAVDAYEGTPYAASFWTNFSARMRMMTNLAHAARHSPGSEIAGRLCEERVEDILAKIDTRFTPVNLAMGAAEALAAIAEVVRLRGDGARADLLAATAAERQVLEEGMLAISPGMRRECEPVGTTGATVESCFRRIP